MLKPWVISQVWKPVTSAPDTPTVNARVGSVAATGVVTTGVVTVTTGCVVVTGVTEVITGLVFAGVSERRYCVCVSSVPVDGMPL